MTERLHGLLRRAAWTVTSLALLVVVVSPAGGCISPPLLLETPRRPLSLAEFPPHAEVVEVEAGPGVVLRGIWVPARSVAPAAAPVVLDFLESSGTLLTGARSMGTRGSIDVMDDDEPMLDEAHAQGAPPEIEGPLFDLNRRRFSLLPLLGFSVLCLDYTGVGASDGERSTGNLRRDAQAAWAEAVRRAGGDASRVILRATSIGALAVAALLQDGARPGAVILLAPVRAETVGANGARAFEGGLMAFLVGWLLRQPVDADLLAELQRARPPLLVVVPESDAFLRHDERVELRRGVEELGGTLLVRHPDHIALALAARDMLAAEGWFLAGLPLHPSPAERLDAALAAWTAAAVHDAALTGTFAPARAERMRLAQLVARMPCAWPALAAAIAMSDPPPAERREVLDLLAWLPDDALARLDAAGLVRLADFDDPAGRLDLEMLRLMRGRVPDLAGCSVEQVLERLAGASDPATDGKPTFSVSFSVKGEVRVNLDPDAEVELASCVRHAVRSLGERGLSQNDSQRQVMRLALKSAGIPDRVQADGEGRFRVEALQDGEWRSVAVRGWMP